MKDQVSSLNKKGVKAVILGPQSSYMETKDASEGKYNLVFTSRLWRKNWDKNVTESSFMPLDH